jgi:hypothetical protein
MGIVVTAESAGKAAGPAIGAPTYALAIRKLGRTSGIAFFGTFATAVGGFALVAALALPARLARSDEPSDAADGAPMAAPADSMVDSNVTARPTEADEQGQREWQAEAHLEMTAAEQRAPPPEPPRLA